MIRFVNWLDSIRFRYLDPTMWFKRNKRLGSKLLRDGSAAEAQIVGIKVTPNTGTDSMGSSLRWEFALEVQSDELGAFRGGCRQQLLPHLDRAGLGETVKVRYDRERRVIIDWPATLEGWGLKGDGTEPTGDYKSLKEAPADGVEDTRFESDSKALRKGEPAKAEVLGARQSQSALGPVANKDVDLRVELPSGERRDVTLTRLEVPEHAGDLLREGSVLPVVVDVDRPDKVTIDWAAALTGGPGREAS